MEVFFFLPIAEELIWQYEYICSENRLKIALTGAVYVTGIC